MEEESKQPAAPGDPQYAEQAEGDGLRRLDAVVEHVGRVSVMGELAASLAHELNQPLQAIVTYAGGLLGRLRSDGAADAAALQVLERIVAEGNRAAEIVRRVRAFVRRREPRHAPFSPAAAVADAIALTQSDARRRRIALAFEDRLGNCPVHGDAVQIEQVVLNLVRNAFDAVELFPDPRRQVTVALRPIDGSIEVSVMDRGSGVPDDLMGRLFEPFFTTKAEGMGMGLAISRSIVHAHGGALAVRNNAEGGATFAFTLPMHGGAAS